MIKESHITALEQILKAAQDEFDSSGRWSYFATGWAGKQLREMLHDMKQDRIIERACHGL